eukprot:gnl/TRDRNA2_/TRDRNA2_151053_c0_seq1.p1 gnl/TRDRNA2_/TRDRNA2_151053_c0~~gnl/TRDRNA2_/TRDRNA2_151053_c0_seq1.p1  ORF type:complete len:805 (-),score=109.64 gnl/TRDRNA2_/TRDRNA2_151053_c0_seq1:190-2556(-)
MAATTVRMRPWVPSTVFEPPTRSVGSVATLRRPPSPPAPAQRRGTALGGRQVNCFQSVGGTVRSPPLPSSPGTGAAGSSPHSNTIERVSTSKSWVAASTAAASSSEPCSSPPGSGRSVSRPRTIAGQTLTIVGSAAAASTGAASGGSVSLPRGKGVLSPVVPAVSVASTPRSVRPAAADLQLQQHRQEASEAPRHTSAWPSSWRGPASTEVWSPPCGGGGGSLSVPSGGGRGTSLTVGAATPRVPCQATSSEQRVVKHHKVDPIVAVPPSPRCGGGSLSVPVPAAARSVMFPSSSAAGQTAPHSACSRPSSATPQAPLCLVWPGHAQQQRQQQQQHSHEGEVLWTGPGGSVQVPAAAPAAPSASREIVPKRKPVLQRPKSVPPVVLSSIAGLPNSSANSQARRGRPLTARPSSTVERWYTPSVGAPQTGGSFSTEDRSAITNGSTADRAPAMSQERSRARPTPHNGGMPAGHRIFNVDSPVQVNDQPPLDKGLSEAHYNESSATNDSEADLCLHVGVCSLVGQKLAFPDWVNQDMHLALPLGKGQLLVGVFDGHGVNGQVVAERVRSLFEQYAPGVMRAGHPLSFAFTHLFSLVQQVLEREGLAQLSGTTATVAVLDSMTGEVSTAHVGDSKLVLVRDGSLEFETMDHVILPEDEARILSQGGEVRELPEPYGVSGVKRLFGPSSNLPGLAMARSLGDLEAHVLGALAEPEVHTGMKFSCGSALLVASDGVWDKLPKEEVATELCRNATTADPEADARALVLGARARWHPEGDIDDITAVVVQVRRDV